MHATGTFDVTLAPLESHTPDHEGASFGHLSIDKAFHGPLEATSRGEMLSVRTKTPGSAGYVAIEQVRGVLEGKRGTFVLQHHGIVSTGGQRLILEVVPDSGTGELEDLSGTMAIEIDDGTHRYAFDYVLGTPDTA